MSYIEFEVVSYNVNGIRDDRKRRNIFNFLKKETSNKAKSLDINAGNSLDQLQSNRKTFRVYGQEKCYLVMEPRIAQESVFALDII